MPSSRTVSVTLRRSRRSVSATMLAWLCRATFSSASWAARSSDSRAWSLSGTPPSASTVAGMAWRRDHRAACSVSSAASPRDGPAAGGRTPLISADSSCWAWVIAVLASLRCAPAAAGWPGSSAWAAPTSSAATKTCCLTASCSSRARRSRSWAMASRSASCRAASSSWPIRTRPLVPMATAPVRRVSSGTEMTCGAAAPAVSPAARVIRALAAAATAPLAGGSVMPASTAAYRPMPSHVAPASSGSAMPRAVSSPTIIQGVPPAGCQAARRSARTYAAAAATTTASASHWPAEGWRARPAAG